jgi:parallel beta-helix repeat protein
MRPDKIKGAATAAFLLVLLVAVLPFFFSGVSPDSSPFQTATAVSNDLNGEDSAKPFTEPIVPTQSPTSGAENTAGQYSSTSPLNQTGTIQTQTSIQVLPNPVALGQAVSFVIVVSPLPPTPADRFSNLTLLVYRPDGTVDLLGPLESDANGSRTVSYKPEMIGSYTAHATYAGQVFASRNVTYLGAESSTATFSVQSEVPITPRVPGTWIVDDDGPADFRTIQEAIDAAAPGDTIFVRPGTYIENVVVYKPLSLIGQNASHTIILAKNPGTTVLVTKSHVTISTFTVRGRSTLSTDIGIYVSSSASFCNISGNILTDHGCAVSLGGNDHNVDSNFVTNSPFSGIYLNGSSNNVISNNIVMDCAMTGIFISYPSTHNILRDNNMTRNSMNLHVIGYELQSFMNDIDTSNTVNGKPIYYWINKTNLTVPSNAGAVYLINCTCMTVQGLQLTSTGQGVLLTYTSNSTVKRNSITNCDNGVRIQYASNNLIVENNISGCHGGISLMNATNNIISDNTVNANSLNGIWVFLSSGNQFYRNHLTNKIQVSIDKLAVWNNVWDNGKEGNYWSDYSGTDANGNGVGDTPYVIDVNNVDHYPLMAPSRPF